MKRFLKCVCADATHFHMTMMHVIVLACCFSWVSLWAQTLPQSPESDSERTLYNGIVLPTPWPPQYEKYPSPEPMTPPYLKNPPKIISIDVGRQLLVDDFLIQETTLKRQFHLATLYEHNPVLKADQPWEQEGGTPSAMPFSDGVWFDPADNQFKLWYLASYTRYTCLALSQDGIRWNKPDLGVVAKTNIVKKADRDSSTVWMDLQEKDPAKRFKMFTYSLPDKARLSACYSPDGIHWGADAIQSGTLGDRSTVFYNPFRKVWVYSVRGSDRKQGLRRVRQYAEHADSSTKAWQDGGSLTRWTSADGHDTNEHGHRGQLYNLDVAAYESLLLGQFTILHNPALAPGRPKINQVRIGFSRDGFHWDRPDRRVFLPVSEQKGDWNWGNVQSAGGGCLVVGDRLYFYFSGRAGTGQGTTEQADAAGGTGLAFLRRDGFASMDASKDGGVLTTRPLTFQGKHLFVNLQNEQGELLVEVLDQAGQVIAPFSAANCLLLRGNQTLMQVSWRQGDDLSAFAGKPVRFRFHLKNGSLYAFWVSPDASGASYGYVAAGGPGFTSHRDTVGRAAYTAAAQRVPAAP